MDLYPRVVRFVREQPWALMPETLAIMTDLLRFRAAGGRLTPEEIRARLGEPRPPRYEARRWDIEAESWQVVEPPCDDGERVREAHVLDGDGRCVHCAWHKPEGAILAAADGSSANRPVIAVLGIYGLITQRADMFTEMSGGTSTERLAARFRAAVADTAVKAIVFDVDSPGGGVYGVPELATEILDARGQKPMKAQVNSLSASAAYWLTTQADEVVITPSGEAGSIGVYAAHVDLSKQSEMLGENWTLISAGKFKTEGNPFEPLTKEALAAIQGRVDDYYGMFTRAVAKGRGVSVDQVRKGYGQGRVLGAAATLAEGMVDRIGTLDETVRRAGRSSSAPKAETPPPTPVEPEAPAPHVVAEWEAARARGRFL